MLIYKATKALPYTCLVAASFYLLPVLAAPTGTQYASLLLDLSLQELIDIPLVTASRKIETKDKTPAHVMVVTRKQIRERRYKNLADLLEDMPGIDFQRGSKSSQYNQIAMQGYVSPNKILLMQDGVRIGHPGGGNIPMAENFALYQAKQVEIVYGPAAALYGADAVAGVINIITEAGNGNDGNWVSIGGGRFDTQEASLMSGIKLKHGIKLALGGHFQRSERADLAHYYPADFKPVAIPNGATAAEREDYQGAIASHSLYARADITDKLMLGAYRYHFNSLTSTGDPYATAKYDDGAQWQTTTDTFVGRYKYQFAESLSGQLQVDYSHMEVDPSSYYSNKYNDFSRGYSYVLGERLSVENAFDWQLDARNQLQFGFGWQSYSDIEAASLPERYKPSKSASNQGLTYINTDLNINVLDEDFENWSAYTQWQAQWSGAFSTTVGVRYDEHSAYGGSVNPRAGAVWRINPEHVLKLLYAEAFRAPSPEEKLSYYGAFDANGDKDDDGRYIGNNFRVPNLDLEPEKARTLSFVWDWRPTSKLNLITNLYYNQIKDLVVSSELEGNDTTTIPGAVLINPKIKENAGSQSQQGLDVIAQWHYYLNSDWQGELWSSASWIQGRVKERGSVAWDIPYVSTYKAKLGSTFRYRETFTITPKLYFIGESTNGQTQAPTNSALPPSACDGQVNSAPERCTTPGYVLVNLSVGWHNLLQGHASLWLDAYNLLDTRYHAAAGASSGTFVDMPQQPRRWVVSMDYRF